MDEVELRFREVLLQLALLSNGRTASWEPSGGGGDSTPMLGPEDAPHEYFAKRWDRATSYFEREKILRAAEERLKHERRSRGDRGRVESKADRDARIIEYGEGLPAREVANWARCGIKDVWNAREEAGRDTDRGRKPRNGRALENGERRAEIQRLAEDEQMPARQIANALELSYSTVLRELGQKA